jgi:hypothetical protein
MLASHYREYLERLCESEGLRSSLRPVPVAQIIDIGEQLGSTLPEQYENFLLEVGVGDECAGLGRWLHLDLDRAGSVLERTQAFAYESGGLLLVYDALDGDYYGFAPGEQGYERAVWRFNAETGEIAKVADDFGEFLDLLAVEDEQPDERR